MDFSLGGIYTRTMSTSINYKRAIIYVRECEMHAISSYRRSTENNVGSHTIRRNVSCLNTGEATAGCTLPREHSLGSQKSYYATPG